MTQGIRVAPTLACLLPSDRPIVVAPNEAGEVTVEPFGDDRVVVHGPDGRDSWAHLGPSRRLPDGRSVVEVVVDGWRFELELEDDARATIAAEGVAVVSATVEPPSQQRVRHTYTLQLPDAARLQALMRAMRNVPGVYDVSRAQHPATAAQ